MSDIDHAAAIKRIASTFHKDFPWPADELRKHADALAAQLAKAEARVARWKRLATTIFDTAKGQAWVDERAAAIADLRSQGDLPSPWDGHDDGPDGGLAEPGGPQVTMRVTAVRQGRLRPIDDVTSGETEVPNEAGRNVRPGTE